MLHGVPKVRVEVEGGRARIFRPGARFAVVRKGEAYQGSWVADGAEFPAGASDTFTEGEARIALALLRGRERPGRAPDEPTTEDGRLVARACAVLRITAGELAVRAGTGAAVLSRARHGSLSASARARILELLAKE